MELFDFIHAIFSSAKYKTVSPSVKKKYFFMTQRILSIHYPLQANAFNRTGINQVIILDWWHSFLVSKHRSLPGWVKTTSKKSTDKKSENKTVAKINDFSDEVLSMFRKHRNIEQKDIEFWKLIEPESLYEELKKIDTFLKENS